MAGCERRLHTPFQVDVLVQRLHLAPKAIIALKKAREAAAAGCGSRAAKGCKGACSVRHPGGPPISCFRPHVCQNPHMVL